MEYALWEGWAGLRTGCAVGGRLFSESFFSFLFSFGFVLAAASNKPNVIPLEFRPVASSHGI